MVQAVKNLETIFSPEYLVQNNYLMYILAIFLTMYGPRLHPKLPTPLRNLFRNL